MTERSRLDKTFNFIMERMVATGQAPQATEIASELGVAPPEGRRVLHDLFATRGFPGWLHPKSDLIVSFAPFNNLPNQHRITVEGVQKWFGQ